MRRLDQIFRVGVGPFQWHEPPAVVGRLKQQFEPALLACEPDERQWKPLEWMLTGNPDNLGKILGAGSVTGRPSACA